jgi:LPXTG-site transpeptidase (sortase) family protein
MRYALRLGGTLLIVASLLGMAALAVLLLNPEPAASPFSAARGQAETSAQQRSAAATSVQTGNSVSDGAINVPVLSQSASANRAIGLPITHVEIPAISLSADVVPAGLIQRDGGVTWEVPAFKIGHAETTVGAGQPGNAVLLGHVTSVRSGNVFANLDQVEVGQAINVFADRAEFTYSVVSTSHVPRSDTSSIQPGDAAAVSLITCTGVWLPTIWDYTERLVVRAELNHQQPTGQVARY